jgi:hypothetical protein
MKGNNTNQVCWYRHGMNRFLSEKGFVHFYAREAKDMGRPGRGGAVVLGEKQSLTLKPLAAQCRA